VLSRKVELREKKIKLLKEFSGEIRKKKERNLIDKLVNSSIWQDANCIALTNSLSFEINTKSLIKQGFYGYKKIVVPIIKSSGIMDFYEITPDTPWRTIKFGLLEPISEKLIGKNEIDLIIVPGIVFSTSGYRIGFGGGFFDRYLKDFKGATASLVFSFQIDNSWKPERFDEKVNKIYLEKIGEISNE